MELKNGYKLIYQKDGKLYASKENIPTANDAEISYGDVTADQIKEFKLIYEKEATLRGAATNIPTKDDAVIKVLAGDVEVFGAQENTTTEDENTTSTDTEPTAVNVPETEEPGEEEPDEDEPEVPEEPEE